MKICITIIKIEWLLERVSKIFVQSQCSVQGEQIIIFHNFFILLMMV